jgi:hypothetical protein
MFAGAKNLTLKISMSDFMRRVNGLSNWFEKRRHALAFDFVFAAFTKRFDLTRPWQRVLLIAS